MSRPPVLGGETTNETDDIKEVVELLPIEHIEQSPYQARQHFNDTSMAELAASIKQHGLLQPITVKKIHNDRYMLIAGERRFRACIMLGHVEIRALIREASSEDMLLLGLIENMQRENINAAEEAEGLYRLKTEFHLKDQDIADSIGKSRPTVSNILRLMKLEPTVLAMLKNEDFERGHAKLLLQLSGEEQIAFAKKIVEGGWSVDRTSKELANKGSETKTNPALFRTYEKQLSAQVSEHLGLKAKVKLSGEHKGQLNISFNDESEKNWLLAQIEAIRKAR